MSNNIAGMPKSVSKKNDKGETTEIVLKLQRPVTDELRQTVQEDFPELVSETWISAELREKAVEALALALAMSTFNRWSEVPGWAVPHALQYGPEAGKAYDPPGSGQPVHLRYTARIALGFARELKALSPEVDIDEEVVFIGALIHDIGKAWESDHANEARWNADTTRYGGVSLRHPSYGMHVALMAGLPEEVCHCVLNHSFEGNLGSRSLECFLVYWGDAMAWALPVQAGLMVPETLATPAAVSMLHAFPGVAVNPRALLGEDSKKVHDELDKVAPGRHGSSYC